MRAVCVCASLSISHALSLLPRPSTNSRTSFHTYTWHRLPGLPPAPYLPQDRHVHIMGASFLSLVCAHGCIRVEIRIPSIDPSLPPRQKHNAQPPSTNKRTQQAPSPACACPWCTSSTRRWTGSGPRWTRARYTSTCIHVCSAMCQG